MASNFRRYGRWGIVAIIGLIATIALDNFVVSFAHAYTLEFKNTELAHLLRCGGYLPSWLVVSVIFVLVDRRAAAGWTYAVWDRGLAMIMSPAIAGILCALIQLVVRRERPNFEYPGYHFRPLWDRTLYGGGLGMPSSHASLAFAAAFVLARLFPSATSIFFLIAAGTAMTRVLSGAHFLSDVYVSIWVGMIAAFMVRWIYRIIGNCNIISYSSNISTNNP